MGGRGSSSGFGGGGSGSGWGKMPKLEGSQKQVDWANNIRDTAIQTIDSQIKNKTEYHKKFKDNESMIAKDLYSDFKKELSKVLQKTTKASDIIDMRNTALNINRFQTMISERSRGMARLMRNGHKYDKKTHTTKKD